MRQKGWIIEIFCFMKTIPDTSLAFDACPRDDRWILTRYSSHRTVSGTDSALNAPVFPGLWTGFKEFRRFPINSLGDIVRGCCITIYRYHVWHIHPVPDFFSRPVSQLPDICQIPGASRSEKAWVATKAPADIGQKLFFCNRLHNSARELSKDRLPKVTSATARVPCP